MRRALAITICGLGLALPAGALAAGGPVPAYQGGTGVSTPGGEVTFVAVGGGRHTIVERIRRAGGLVERYRGIPGSFGVPGAAYDGSTTGLSADGRRLVLAALSRTYPQTRTRFVVLDGVRLRTLARISLPGAYSLDAVSPDGGRLYLTHYKSLPSTIDYEVLSYDLATRRLDPKPIVDPREPDEKMQGQPVARTMSPDGRWAYTLYDRGSEAPFVHALDTAGGRAFCVDLPALADPNGAFDLRLALRGGALQVLRQGAPVALMNTRTLAVSTPRPAPPAKPRPKPQADAAGSGFPWEFGAIPVVALLVGAGLALRRRQLSRAGAAA